MNLSRGVLALAAFLAVLMCPPAYSQAVSISALLESPERYDGKVVTVSGVIAVYRERVSRAGNAYTTFRLQEGGASVAVFVWGYRGLRDGVRVRVTGVFQRVRRVGRFTFYNEIEAQRIDVLGRKGLLSRSEPAAAVADRRGLPHGVFDENGVAALDVVRSARDVVLPRGLARGGGCLPGCPERIFGIIPAGTTSSRPGGLSGGRR